MSDNAYRSYSALLTTDTPAPVAEAIREHDRLLNILFVATADRDAIRRRGPAADDADLNAAADAITKGNTRAVTATPNRERLDADLRAAERTVDAAGLAVRRAYEALRAALSDHGDEWEADLARDYEEARTRLRAALADIPPLMARLDILAARTAFVSDPDNRKAFVNLTPRSAVVVMNGRQYPAKALLDVLADYREQTTPPPSLTLSVPRRVVRSDRGAIEGGIE